MLTNYPPVLTKIRETTIQTEDHVVDRRIILKWKLRKCGWIVRIGLSWLRICIDGNKPSVSIIKDEELLMVMDNNSVLHTNV
jgi:hypothetical protein